jgi:hypothetical protein
MTGSCDHDTMSSLEDLFKAEVKKPFHYKLSLTDINNNDRDIFESMRKIFMTGLVIHYGNEVTKSINITELTPTKIDKIQQYMLSIGIKTNYKVYKESDIDFLYRKFICDIENIKDVAIDVVSNWKTQYIKTIKINVINNNKDSLKKIMDKLRDHTAANYFLKMQAPQTLKDYAILVTISPTEIHVINFEFAKVGDYSKTYCSDQHQQIIKYFRE